MSGKVKIIDSALMRELSAKAAAVPRLRTHYNLHESLEDDINRLCIAATPDSYIRPHRHSDMKKSEIFIILHGHARVVLFDDAGRVEAVHSMRAGGDGVAVIEIAPGVWHTFVAESQDCVAMEIKHGPYVPTDPQDFAAWAPAEGDMAVPAMIRKLHAAKAGDNFQE